MVQIFIAAAGIVGLLLLWLIVVSFFGYLIAWSVRVLPLVGRRGVTQGSRSARNPLTRHTSK